MTTDRKRTLAARACIAKALSAEVAAEVANTRALLRDELIAGSEKAAAVLPDGRVVGEAQFAKPSQSVRVTDSAALMEYVKRARPEEVVVREEIRSSYLTWLLGEAKKQLTADDATGLVVDPDGEVIPGLELATGTPSYLVKITDAAAVDQVINELFGTSTMRALLRGDP